MKVISIIIPVYNEKEVLPIFLNRLIPILEKSDNYKFEIIFVNDGSSDETLAYLTNLKHQYNNLIVVDLSRNFGKEAALTAGIDISTGDAVIPIDSDLQDPPELITEMIHKWEKGFDVIEAKRIERKTDNFFKQYSAKIFYYVLNSLSKHNISQNVGDFRLMSRNVVDSVKKLEEKNRFMKGLFSWPGFKLDYIEFKREKRNAGKTKFNIFKLFQLAIDGITSFSIVPLKIITLLGLFGTLISFVFSIVIIFQKIFVEDFVIGYAFLIIIILFFGSIQLLSIGVIGEYVGKIYFEVKKRPIYIIKKIY